MSDELTAAELTVDEQNALDELNQTVARDLAAGKQKEVIVQELIKQDWPEESARALVENIEQVRTENKPKLSRATRKALAKKALRRLRFGFLLAAVGIIVNIAKYGSGNDIYVLSWVSIVFGVITFFSGFSGYLKHKS